MTILRGLVCLAMLVTSTAWAESYHAATTDALPKDRPRSVDAGGEVGDWYSPAEREEMWKKLVERRQLREEKTDLENELRSAPTRIDDLYSKHRQKYDLEHAITAALLSGRTEKRDWPADLAVAVMYLQDDPSVWDKLYASIPKGAALYEVSRRLQMLILGRDSITTFTDDERKQLSCLFAELRTRIIKDGILKTKARLNEVNARLDVLSREPIYELSPTREEMQRAVKLRLKQRRERLEKQEVYEELTKQLMENLKNP